MKKYFFKILIFCILTGGGWKYYFENKKHSDRLKKYQTISSYLALLSNKNISELLEKNATLSQKDIKVATGKITIKKSEIFLKKIRITDCEKQPQNILSTKNLFSLPIYYYGINSLGFCAWRELYCHLLANTWILTNECSNFPLLYHWRCLQKNAYSRENQAYDTAHWESQDVTNYVDALKNSSEELILFLEYFPQTLEETLDTELTKISPESEKTLKKTEINLNKILNFIESKGMFHLDPHFKNILTDNKDLYLSDFGLVLHRDFELEETELALLETHKNYPKIATQSFLCEKILKKICLYDEKESLLTDLNKKKLPKWIRSFLKKNLSTYLATNKFWIQIYKNPTTIFPKDSELKIEATKYMHLLKF